MISYNSIPTTRYVGSKNRLAQWIWSNIEGLNFKTFLDAFGGTGTIGYCAKMHGKKVFYNDNLRFNYLIGKAIIENNSTKLTSKDISFILNRRKNIKYPKFIQENFKGFYYTNQENIWLDMVVTNILHLNNKTKQSMAFYALIQSCIRKRPYNLFHRKNLYMRFSKVKRSFGNKTTWDTPFGTHFLKFIDEVNYLVISNKKKNKSFNLDVFDIPIKPNIIYIDSPYMSPKTGYTNYLEFYHFLEGLVGYKKWSKKIDTKSSIKCLKQKKNIWKEKDQIKQAFDKLFKKFRKSIIVVSYRSGGIPSENEIKKLLLKYKSHVSIKRKTQKYVLSHEPVKELLFIAN